MRAEKRVNLGFNRKVFAQNHRNTIGKKLVGRPRISKRRSYRVVDEKLCRAQRNLAISAHFGQVKGDIFHLSQIEGGHGDARQAGAGKISAPDNRRFALLFVTEHQLARIRVDRSIKATRQARAGSGLLSVGQGRKRNHALGQIGVEVIGARLGNRPVKLDVHRHAARQTIASPRKPKRLKILARKRFGDRQSRGARGLRRRIRQPLIPVEIQRHAIGRTAARYIEPARIQIDKAVNIVELIGTQLASNIDARAGTRDLEADIGAGGLDQRHVQNRCGADASRQAGRIKINIA